VVPTTQSNIKTPRALKDARRRQFGRKVNWPLVALVAVAVLAVVVLVRFIVLSVSGPDFVKDRMTPLVTASNAQGEALAALFGETDTVKLTERLGGLEDWAVQVQATFDDARAAEPPDDVATADAFLVGCLKARAVGARSVTDSLKGVTEPGVDQQQVATALTTGMVDVLAGDRLCSYADAEVAEVMERAGTDVRLPPSVWFPDVANAQLPAMTRFVQRVTGTPQIGGVRDLAITAIDTVPAKSGVDGGVARIEGGAGTIDAKVTVKNLGDRKEDKITVKVTLRPRGASDEQVQLITGEIRSLAPGEEKQVTVTGLEPAEGRNRLSASAGPLPEERNTGDNLETIELDYVR
jgi:hypothetical protein